MLNRENRFLLGILIQHSAFTIQHCPSLRRIFAMMKPAPVQFRKRRPRGKLPATDPTPPPATDSIISVTHDGANFVLVVVDGIVVNVAPTNAMWLYPLDGDPVPATDFELIGPSQVRFTFPVDVSEYLNWHVEDGA